MRPRAVQCRRPRRPFRHEHRRQLGLGGWVLDVRLHEPPLAAHLVGAELEDRVAPRRHVGPCDVVQLVDGPVEHAPQPGVVGPAHRRRRHRRRRELDRHRRARRRSVGPVNAHDECTSPDSSTVRPPAAARSTIHDDQALALGGVAVPLVVVHDPPVEHGVAVGQQPVHPRQRAGPRQLDRVDHHAAGHDRPRPGVVGQPLAQPGPLLVAQQRAGGIVERGRFLVAGLAVAPDEAGVEEDQLGQVADRDRDRHVTLGSPRRAAAAAATPGGRRRPRRARPATARACRGRGAWRRRATRCRRGRGRPRSPPSGGAGAAPGRRVGAQLGQASAVVVLGDRRVGGFVGAWALSPPSS